MQQYFISNGFFDKEDVHHIVNVMRCKTGDKVIVVEKGNKFIATIEINNKEVAINNLEPLEENNELEGNVFIGMGLLKSDKFDLVVQKCAELGVSTLIPIIFERNVVKVKDNVEKKVARWNKIAKSACEQSKRNFIMKVEQPCTVKEISTCNGIKNKYVCYESKEGIYLKDCSFKESTIALIGPEGGITEQEIKILTDNGFVVTTLGKQILRAETAAITAAVVCNMNDNK